MSASARPDDSRRLARIAPKLQARHCLREAIRAFFSQRDFLEVETPVRINAPANEDYVDAIPAGTAFLRTSPELHMKRLLAAGYPRIYQLGPCFRAEERGRRHLSEFTMLEWYRAEADYLDLLEDARGLLLHAAREVAGAASCTWRGTTIHMDAEWFVIPVADAFRRFANADVDQALATGNYEQLLVERIEPALPPDRPSVLIDYPAACAALARRKPQAPELAERWELYAGGLELANTFSELTDPGEQRERFRQCQALREREGRPAYPLDESFLEALHTLPPCAGAALGFDRLVMLLTDTQDIAEVVPFPDDWP